MRLSGGQFRLGRAFRRANSLSPNDKLLAAQLAKAPYLAYKMSDWSGELGPTLIDYGSAGINAQISTGNFPFPVVVQDPDNGLGTIDFTPTLENSTGRAFTVAAASFDNAFSTGLTIEFLAGPSVNIIGNIASIVADVHVGAISNRVILLPNKGGRGSFTPGTATSYSFTGATQEWRYHIFALTFDGVDSWKFYRDGLLLMTHTGAPVSQSRTSLSFGSSGVGSRSSRMSNFCIYKRELSDAELLENYDAIGFSLNIAKLR